MNLGIVNAGIGVELIAANQIGWLVKFVHTDWRSAKVIKHNFPEVPIITGGIPKRSVEVFSGRTPSPSRASNKGPARMDRNYLDVALQFFGLAKELSARWMVWETGPRFVVSNKGQDLKKVLLKMGELGYGFAYRILDSKYFGVPQSRRKLYVIGYSGDWRPPAAVLFERTTRGEYFSQIRDEHNTFKSAEEFNSQDYSILPYTFINTNLFKICPTLPILRDPRKPLERSNPFLLISRKANIARQLTPLEWERLQGLCDNYTKLSPEAQPFTNKTSYGLIGNAGCVPVYIWIYHRIQMIQNYLNQE